MDYEHLWAGDKTHGLVIVEAAILGRETRVKTGAALRDL